MKLMIFHKNTSRILLSVLSIFCIAWFDGDTDLIKAVKEEDIVKIIKLINDGVDINEKGKNGCTALIVSVENYNIDIIKILLEHGAKVLIYDNNGITAYGHIGWEKIDQTNKAAILMRQDDPKLKEKEHFDQIMKTQISALLDEARLKEVAHIADDIKNDNDLIKAAYKKDIEAVIELIKQGQDINVKGVYNWTALIHSVANCDLEMTKFLLDNGAEFDRSINKFTCIHAKEFDFKSGQAITALIQDARINNIRKKSK